jgi:hypothetical protein
VIKSVVSLQASKEAEPGGAVGGLSTQAAVNPAEGRLRLEARQLRLQGLQAFFQALATVMPGGMVGQHRPGNRQYQQAKQMEIRSRAHEALSLAGRRPSLPEA